MSSSETEPIPRLRVTREFAARRIAEAIREFEQLRTRISSDVLTDIQDEFDIRRRHAIELLRSLFDHAAPASEFEHETARRVFYTNTSSDEQRRDLDDDSRQCIKQLRGFAALLDFYKNSPSESHEEKREPTHVGDEPRTNHSIPPTAPRDPAPPVVAVFLFLLVLLGTATLVIWQQNSIEGAHGPAALLLYLISALFPAILLFGLFRSVAKLTGKLYGLPVELGGPAALFIIVLVLLIRVAPPTPIRQEPVPAPIATSATAASVTTTAANTPPMNSAPSNADNSSPHQETAERTGAPEPSPTAERYLVHLVIPTALSHAAVWLDGHEAIIVERTASIITIKVPATDENHLIRLNQDGVEKCSSTVAIKNDNVTLYPCGP